MLYMPSGYWYSEGGVKIGWDEINASHWENKIRVENGLPLRKYYGIEDIFDTDGNFLHNQPLNSTLLIYNRKSLYYDNNEKAHYNGVPNGTQNYNY